MQFCLRLVAEGSGRLVFKAHKLLHYSTLGSRVIKKRKKVLGGTGERRQQRTAPDQSPHPAPHTLHPRLYTLHPSPYTADPTPYNLHPAPNNLQATPCTAHCTPFTVHPTPYVLTPYTQQPTPYTLQKLKVDIRLPEKGNSNSRGARPVYSFR